MVAGFVLRRGAGGHGGIDGAASAVARFSTIALGAVVVMVITGTLQAWRQVGGLDELAATDFGRLLVVKIALVAAMLCAARYSRRLTRREAPRAAAAALSFGPAAARDMPAPLAHLRRSVAIEATVAMAVVAVTAALVNAIPARAAGEAAGPTLPFSTDLVKAGVTISVTLEPARTGLNDLHVYVTGDDRPLDALAVSATMTLAATDTGPITVPLVKSGAGHWSAFGFPVPIAGTWELEVAALVSEIDLVRVSTDVSIT